MDGTLFEVVREQGVDEYQDGGRVIREYLLETEHNFEFYVVLSTRENPCVDSSILARTAIKNVNKSF